MEGLRVMMVAGEASGDMHGAHLARELQARDEGVRLFGMGATMMNNAGVRLLFNPTSQSIIGFVEALKSASVLRRVLLRLGEVMDRQDPDVVVLIDFPGFNMRLAEIASRKGFPVVYYFSPSAWAWGKGRAEKLAKSVTKIASVFPFEAEVYEEAGADVTFVGHPLLDIVKPTKSKKEMCEEFGLDPERPIVALLPGSREGEIKNLFPVMLKSAELLAREVAGCQFIVPVAHTIASELMQSMAKKYSQPVVYVNGMVHDALNAADCAVITSGTATLEAAIVGTPHIIVYKTSASTYLLGKMVIKIPYIGLPNIVAGRKVVPELIQGDATAKNIVRELLNFFRNPEGVKKMKADFREIVAKLGEPGAVGRVAELVLDIGRRHRSGEFS